MTVPATHDPEDSSSPGGVAQFMTVDAFNVTVAPGRSDAAIVIKDHSGPLPEKGRTTSDHQAAVQRERDWLRAAVGISGVVTLVECDEEHPHTVVTEFAGSRTLRSDCPGPRETARALACVAETITALADRGLTHGSIEPEHVILATDGTAVLCSPDSSDDPSDDLMGLGRCIEFATEQWEKPPDSLTRWLLLAKQLMDHDPTVGSDRAARILTDLIDPDPIRTRTRPVRPLLLVSLAAVLVLSVVALTRRSSAVPITGPELEVEGNVVRVGRQGDIAVVQPPNRCAPARIYLLDPATFQVWTFDRFETGRAASPLVMVPGATTLGLSEAVDGCVSVVARGPAGEVALP